MAYSIDTRTIQPGDIFIPVKGPNFDGHNFIEEAKRKGAAQILDVDLAQFAKTHRQKFDIPVIAITGSAGKTTTKDMLAAVLSQKFKIIKSAENQNNEIGVPLTLLKITEETEIAIVEMAMRGLGQIEYLADLALPTHALITNIGYTHIELLGSREAIAVAKSEVIRKGCKVFLNQRGGYYDFLQQRSAEKEAIIYPYTYDKTLEANLAAITAVAKTFDFTETEIQQGLADYQSSAHRLKFIKANQLTIIDDAYNSNPDGLAFALDILREQPGRKIAVLGDMKELGEWAERLHQDVNISGVDCVITYGPLAKFISHQQNFAENQKTELITYLKNYLKPQDTVLIKGSRSMKMEEITTSLEKG